MSGTAVGGNPTGTITVYACGPATVPTPCTSTADQVGSGEELHPLPGTDDTVESLSSLFAPDAPGYWCFAAYYSGNTNYSASSDTSTDGCFDATPPTQRLSHRRLTRPSPSGSPTPV